MLHHVLMSLASLVVALPAPKARAQEALQMRVVRYYRADHGQTLVKAFVEIPFALLQPTGSGPDDDMVYTVSAQVTDSAGLSLLPEPKVWTKRVPAAARLPGATSLEQMEFAVAPGRFRMTVSVTDSVSGKQAQTSAEFTGYAAEPEASDVLLSPLMRLAGDGDSVPQPGEMRRGNTILVPAVDLRLTPLRTKAFYMLEAYTSSQEQSSGTMQVAVLNKDGESVFRTSPTAVPLAPGGGILQGQLDLDGLPPGNYRMQVAVTVNGHTVERSAPFSMAGLQETLARDSARQLRDRNSDEGYFGAMDEAQLDSAEAPLVLIAKSSELKNYDQLSVSAKRRFLVDFWKKRDQRPETPRNEERERFYGAIAYADRTFRVGRGSQEPGWKSDRGRIYTKYGAPDDQLRRVPSGFAPPYEVWRYTRGRPRYFIFADQNGFGAYKLVQTNDLTESGVPNWREILTEDAVTDIGHYLGVDFYGGSGISP